MGFGIGIGISPTLGQGVGGSIRLVPSSANIFYLVTRGSDGVVRGIRFQRNSGAAADSVNLGVQWPEWRVTGETILASMTSDPTSPQTTFTDDGGAQDVVAVNGSGKYFGSVHGLGAGGALNSETLLINGVTADPTVARYGNSFELTNSTTATDGTSTITRSLTTTINVNGGLHYKLNSISITSMAAAYVGMAIGSGTDFTEDDLKLGTAWNTAPLGSGACYGYLDGVNAHRMRDPLTGRYISIVGAMKGLAGFSRSEVSKIAGTRTKAYLSLFTSVAALANAEWDLDWGIMATGSISPGSNLLPNTDWTTGWVAVANAGGVNGVSAGVLTMTASGGTSDTRYHRAIPGCVSGSYYMEVVDAATTGQYGITSLLSASSNINGSRNTPVPAFTQAAQLGRNIRIFAATQNDPDQRFQVSQGISGAVLNDVVQWSNPAAYAMAA